MTDLEAVLIAALIWMYYFGTILSAAHYLEKSNGRDKMKACVYSLGWFFIVPYACITINKGRGL